MPATLTARTLRRMAAEGIRKERRKVRRDRINAKHAFLTWV